MKTEKRRRIEQSLSRACPACATESRLIPQMLRLLQLAAREDVSPQEKFLARVEIREYLAALESAERTSVVDRKD